jgi:hypothetical protein
LSIDVADTIGGKPMNRPSSQETEERDAVVVFMEPGAALPEFALKLQSLFAENVVLVEGVEESPNEFAERAIHRLQQLAASGYVARVSMLVAGRQAGADIFMARYGIAHAVAACTTQQSPRDLILVGHEGLSSQGRADLKELAGVLSQEFGEHGPNIRLLLRSPERPMARTPSLVANPTAGASSPAYQEPGFRSPAPG